MSTQDSARAVLREPAPLSMLNFGVSESGASTGPVFVLLHGIGVSHRYYSRLQNALERRGRVIALDLPGFGGTAKPSHALSVERYAAAIGRALDVLGVVRCVVVGQSMGTQFAVELARRRPSLVSQVVLIGPVVDSHRRTVLDQTLALARDSLAEPLSANAVVFTDYLRCGPRWYLAELGPMLGYPLEKRLAELSHPVLVIRGRADPIAREEWSRSLVEAAARGRYASFEGHHLVHYTAATDVAGAILAFRDEFEPE